MKSVISINLKKIIPLAFILVLIYLDLGDFIGPTLLSYILLTKLSKVYKKDKFRNFRFPPRYKVYFIFLGFSLFSTFWAANIKISFIYFSYFVSGFLFWLTYYNERLSKEKMHKEFNFIVIFLGVIYGLLTISKLLQGSVGYSNAFSLIDFSSSRVHHHIGDLWALCLVLIGLVYAIYNHKKILILIPFGILLLFISLSRAAYLALIAGALFVIVKGGLEKRYKAIFWFFIVVSLILFLYASSKKSTIEAHEAYILQGIVGTIRNPLGIGIGNFKIISNDPKNSFFKFSSGSSVAHNIILEVMTGMGVFGFSFIIWLVMVLKDIFLKSGKANVYGAIFVTLFVNFFFDYTYFIPTMFWLWFISLGFSQAWVRR